MASDLKSKALKGTIWSFIERFSIQIVQFVVTIVMARILGPSDYGLIGMLAIFISLSQVFIDGGFSSALIQRKDRNEDDYSTVFYINIGISIFVYAALFSIAPLIADFYNQPLLKPVLRIYAINLVINAFAAVNKTILTIRIDFKAQSKISFISAFLSGICGISAAYLNYGVWALVIQTVSMSIFNVIFSFIWTKWIPSFKFSIKSFKKLFGFGSKLLVATIISSIYDNVYSLVIGKEFNSKSLGYFSRAQSFTSLISGNIGSILTNVSYPVLSEVQNDRETLIRVYKRYIELSSFIIFPLMMMLCGIASPLIDLLLTEKWHGCVIILQILCFADLFRGLTLINLNLLKVIGRSDLVLRLEVIKKSIAISILIVTIFFHNLIYMCLGLVGYSCIAFYINTYYTNKILNYGYGKQFRDFIPYLLLSISILVITLISSIFISNSFLSLIISIPVSLSFYLLMCNIYNLYAYKTLSGIIKNRISKYY